MGGEGSMGSQIKPQHVKFAQSMIPAPPPPEFARKGKLSLAPVVNTHFGDIVLWLDSMEVSEGLSKPALSGFWMKVENGELVPSPLAALGELLENPQFSEALAAAYEAKKYDGFKKIVRQPLQPGDLALYQTDPDRKRSYLFDIGDGREIVVFSNEGKSVILRGALVKKGTFGSKHLEPLNRDLADALYEHPTISEALDRMVENSLHAPAMPEAAPPVARPTLSPPIPPQFLAKLPMPRKAIEPEKEEMHNAAQEENETHESGSNVTYMPRPPVIPARKMAESAGKMPAPKMAEGKMAKGMAEGVGKMPAKKMPEGMGGKRMQEPEESADEFFGAIRSSLEKAAPKSKGDMKARLPKHSKEVESYLKTGHVIDPYSAQQQILSTLQHLHKERSDADEARMEAIKRLYSRMGSMEKNISALRKELSVYEEGFEKRRANLEGALSGWAKYAAQMGEFQKTLSQSQDELGKAKQIVNQLEKPAQDDAAWAAALTGALDKLAEVTKQLAESEEKHKEKVSRMSGDLQKSIEKSILAAKK